MSSRFKKPRHGKGDIPTRFLYVAGVGDGLGTDASMLERIFGVHGRIEEIIMPPAYRYCYICFSNVDDAEKARGALSGSRVEGLTTNLYIKYAEEDVEEKTVGPPEPECTSESININVPGCVVLENFVSEEEEETLLGGIEGKQPSSEWQVADWEKILSRRVQHYGFPFNYRTLLLDYSADTPPIPSTCINLVHRMGVAAEDLGLIEKDKKIPVTQMTVNEYVAGQGIAGHVDSKACFGPVIYILSCGSGITMTLQKRVEASETSNSGCMLPKDTKKHVWLPRRSLLVLARDARNNWSHGIATRKLDKLNGQIIERQTRISYTFRQALALGPAPVGTLIGSELEKEHVFRVYDSIAQHWHHTRGHRKVHWHRVMVFMESLPRGALVADVGSGDGKYLDVNKKLMTIGCDRSLRLLEVSQQPSHELFCCDAVKLPFRDECFDAAICIAVMHHLASLDRRVAVVRELLRIVRPGGHIMVQAWAMEQEEGSKRTFDHQDVMVPWRLQKKFVEESSERTEGVEAEPQHVVEERGLLTYQRYCHVYKDGELEDLCRSIPGCRILDTGYDRSNWFVELERTREERLGECDVSVPMIYPVFTPRTL
jgi:alkylated DNA repair protein alkB homolog 8